MLNEERVILMTKMASYEAGEGKKSMSLGRYFRGDYISIQLLRAFFCGTVAYLLGFGLYILYDFETLISDIYKMDLFVFAQNIIIWYAVFVAGYCVVTYAICACRYARAKKSLKLYYHNLKKLDSLYHR